MPDTPQAHSLGETDRPGEAGHVMVGARPVGPARAYVLPLVLLLCVTLPHLDAGDWMRSDGAWYGAIGLQAWRTGDFLTLRAEPGELYFNKPPLVFWISGLFLHVFGPGAVAARVSTILAAAGCVVLTVSTARLAISDRTAMPWRGAMWAGIVLSLTYEFFRRTREISLDMWQALFLLAALRLVAGAMVEERTRRATVLTVLAGVPIGLALMCKPLVALAAVPILGVALGCAGRWRLVPWLLGAAVVAAGVAAPWHLAMVSIHGDAFTNQYFGREIADRAAGSDSVNANAVGRWWFYLEKIGRNYWPWLLALVGLIVMVARRRLHSVDRRVLVACAIWVVGWIALLSIFPDRRDRYGLVFYPALAVLPAVWLVLRASGPLQAVLRGFERRAMWAAPVAAVSLAMAPVRVQTDPDPQWPELFAFLEEQGSPEVWKGAMVSHRGARVYLEIGRWPIPFRDAGGSESRTPPPGALLLYHAHDGGVPGPDETEVFRSGELFVTRVGPAAP